MTSALAAIAASWRDVWQDIRRGQGEIAGHIASQQSGWDVIRGAVTARRWLRRWLRAAGWSVRRPSGTGAPQPAWEAISLDERRGHEGAPFTARCAEVAHELVLAEAFLFAVAELITPAACDRCATRAAAEALERVSHQLLALAASVLFADDGGADPTGAAREERQARALSVLASYVADRFRQYGPEATAPRWTWEELVDQVVGDLGIVVASVSGEAVPDRRAELLVREALRALGRSWNRERRDRARETDLSDARELGVGTTRSSPAPRDAGRPDEDLLAALMDRARLSDQQRAVVQRLAQGESYAEIARGLGNLSPVTARVHAHQARAKLAAALGGV